MVEFVNRLITGLVSIAVIVAVLSALWRLPRRRDLTWLAIGLVLGVFSNAVLGGIVVKVGLAPIFVTLHYLLSIILVWNAYVLYHRAGQPDGDGKPALSPRWDHAGALPRAVMSAGIHLYGRAGRPATDAKLVVSKRLCTIGRLLCALVTVVLITGTLVTGAGPHAGDSSAPRYFFAVTEVARVHGFSVWCFLGTSTYALWIARRQGVPKQVDTHAQWLVGAILAQGALGYAQYFSEVPAAMVIFHLLGSVLVFLATLSFYESLFTRPALGTVTP